MHQEGGAQGSPDRLDTHSQPPWGCRAASRSRRGRCGWRRSSSGAAGRLPARCRGCGLPPSSPWCSACPARPGTPRSCCSGGSSPRPGSEGCQLYHPTCVPPQVPPAAWQRWRGAPHVPSPVLPLPRGVWGRTDRSCSRTLAVSRRKVHRSAMQPAIPALTNFMAAVGGTSGGFRPTMVAGGLEGEEGFVGEPGGCTRAGPHVGVQQR